MSGEKEISILKLEIDKVLKKYEKDYMELGKIMDSGNYDESEMKAKYIALDNKSGLNSLFEKLYNLKSKNENTSSRR